MTKKKATPKTKPKQKTTPVKPARKALPATKKRKTSSPVSRTSKIETKLVLLPVEPLLIHAFWEIAPEDISKAKQGSGQSIDDGSFFLRFYDHTGVLPEKETSLYTFDIQIDLAAQNCYVRLKSAGRSFFAELGLRNDDDQFVSITRSGSVDMPSDQPAAYSKEYHLPLGRAHKTISPSSVSKKISHYTVDLAEMNEKEFIHGISSNIPSEK